MTLPARTPPASLSSGNFSHPRRLRRTTLRFVRLFCGRRRAELHGHLRAPLHRRTRSWRLIRGKITANEHRVETHSHAHFGNFSHGLPTEVRHLNIRAALLYSRH